MRNYEIIGTDSYDRAVLVVEIANNVFHVSLVHGVRFPQICQACGKWSGIFGKRMQISHVYDIPDSPQYQNRNSDLRPLQDDISDGKVNIGLHVRRLL